MLQLRETQTPGPPACFSQLLGSYAHLGSVAFFLSLRLHVIQFKHVLSFIYKELCL